MLKRPAEIIRKLKSDERGGTAIEYGLILGLIVIALVGALSNVAMSTTGLWNNVSDASNKS